MYLLKIKALIFLFLSTTNAYHFKLCCPFAHQYDSSNETCFSSQHPQNLKIFNSTVEVDEITGKVLNVINYAWCRNQDGLRETEEIMDPYYLQENGELYVPNLQEVYFKSNRFCLNIKDSSDDNIPIICKFEENKQYSTTIEYSSVLPTTISVDTTSSDKDCDCNTEPPKFPEIFCENLIHGTFEKCVKCTIENSTCIKEECSINISLVEFVDVLEDTKNKHIVQVNKKECPYWQYTYNLNKDDMVHLSILNQTCDEQKNTNTKAAFNTGILLYVGGAFLVIVVLGLIGIIFFFIRRRRIDAAQLAEYMKYSQETPELNPMFRPSTVIYKLPDDLSFK